MAFVWGTILNYSYPKDGLLDRKLALPKQLAQGILQPRSAFGEAVVGPHAEGLVVVTSGWVLFKTTSCKPASKAS